MDTRPLPPGWVSQWEPNAGRYFYVDTTKNPPVSTWDDPRDLPPPYSPFEEPANNMPIAMPSPETYQNSSASAAPSTYPSSVSKVSAEYSPYQQGGYPGQPQPDSYNPYNKYDGAASTSAAKPKKNGFLG
ncbi:hypothetical protein C1645_776717, partial [Glomus cerebriforme]